MNYKPKNMKTKIKQFGIEIEGEFSEKVCKKMKKFGWSVKSDGSIYTCERLRRFDDYDNEPHNGHHLIGLEIVSQPMNYDLENIKNIKKIFDYLQTQYNQNEFHYNDSCGLHFHFSFSPKKPPEIWSENFSNNFKNLIKTKFPNVYQLRSDNTFCRFKLDDCEIANKRFSNRYRFVNLLPAFQRHKTMELRAFPSDQPKKMKKYFLFSVKMINDFIKDANNGLYNKKFNFVGKDDLETETSNFELSVNDFEFEQRYKKPLIDELKLSDDGNFELVISMD